MRSTSLTILAALAVVGALYLGGEFLVPIALAMVLSALFRPVVRALERVHVPAAVGAAVVLVGLAGFATAVGFGLAGPVRGWVAEAPGYLAKAEDRLNRLRRPVQRIANVATKVERVAVGPTTAPVPPAQPSEQEPAPQSRPSEQPLGAPAASTRPVEIVTRLLGTTTQIVGGAVEVLLLLFLILASGGAFLKKLIRVLHRPEDKELADATVHEAEAVVLRWVGATALITFLQGCVVALVMWWLGMPTPILWGLFTFVLEFVPYLGAAVMIGMLSITALATFDSFGHALLAPGSYLVITTLQFNLVSPFIYGQRLKLNPVAILIGVLFWWYVWGVIGAFLAVPILATIKTVADRTERLRPIAEFLGE